MSWRILCLYTLFHEYTRMNDKVRAFYELSKLNLNNLIITADKNKNETYYEWRQTLALYSFYCVFLGHVMVYSHVIKSMLTLIWFVETLVVLNRLKDALHDKVLYDTRATVTFWRSRLPTVSSFLGNMRD